MNLILVIEDIDVMREDLCAILKMEGFEVLGAKDGQQGLQMIEQHDVDAVICDVLMPDLNGYELLEILRQSEEYANLPFVLVTGNCTEEERQRGLSLGANGYIEKPYNIQLLMTLIRDLT